VEWILSLWGVKVGIFSKVCIGDTYANFFWRAGGVLAGAYFDCACFVIYNEFAAGETLKLNKLR